MLPTIERLPLRSRYSSATRYSLVAGLRRRREAVLAPDVRDDGVPLASSIATRVSPRSTLTNTCFFNCLQSFGKLCGLPAVAVPCIYEISARFLPDAARRPWM